MDRKSIVQSFWMQQATTKEQVLRLIDAALITAMPALPGDAEQDAEDAFDEQKSTHLWIVSHAAVLLKEEGKAGQRIYELVKPHRGKIGDSFHDNLCQGLSDADHKAPYNDPLFPSGTIPTWKSHFYDPDTRTNWLGEASPTAVTSGSLYYYLSRDTYTSGDMEQAGYYLGLALHYLTDLTQPMHAANFTWLDSRRFGYHTDFENYARNVRRRISPPVKYTPLAFGSAPYEYLQAVARRTKDRYYHIVCKPEWTQTYERETMTEEMWDLRLGRYMEPMLTDAVIITAGYLLTWMESLSYVASGSSTIRDNKAIGVREVLTRVGF